MADLVSTPIGASDASAILTQICDRCGVERTMDRFPKRRRKGEGHYYEGVCKNCKAAVETERYASKKVDPETGERIAVRPNRGKAKSQEVLDERLREARQKWLAQIDKRQAQRKQYLLDNPGYDTNYRRMRRQTDLHFRIKCNLRAGITTVLNRHRSGRAKKAFKTEKLIGCNMPQLVSHLESLFQEGMTWGNHGFYGWHIDHKIPCSSFNLEDPEEQKRCFHYSNLQPLWWQDNLSKNNRLDWVFDRDSITAIAQAA